MALFQNKYRIESARLKHWDYSRAGMYFITVCTFNRTHYFGEIADGKLAPSEIGRIVDEYWRNIPIHFPKVRLDDCIIMPNHIHGILNMVETPNLGVSKKEGTARNDIEGAPIGPTATPEAPIKMSSEVPPTQETPKLGVSLGFG
jgi:hypothetical protein